MRSFAMKMKWTVEREPAVANPTVQAANMHCSLHEHRVRRWWGPKE